MKIFKVFAFAAGLFLAIESEAATYYTRGTGDITDPIWGTTTTGAGSALPTLANGDIIYIDDNITINTNFTGMDFNITIYLNATVSIGGLWNLGTTASIIFQSSAAKIIDTGGGNSSKIRFGTANTWSGNDPDLTGPGTLDSSFNPATSPLPIQLLYFRTQARGSAIIMEWATVSELNFNYFSLERSSTGKDFSELAQIQGHGTTKERQNYSFEDTRPFVGKNYYRLKAVDFDGYTEYFNTIVFDFMGEKQFDISPNPNNGQGVSFILNFPTESESTVTVFDNLGVIMGSFDISEERSILFPNQLRSGIYYAKFSSPSLSKVARFVVKE